MDQTTALNKLLESSDLVKMLEEIVAPSSFSRLSPATVSGMRITLRTLRESLLATHDALAGELVSRSKQARADAPAAQAVEAGARSDIQSSFRTATAIMEAEPTIRRKDLRASLENNVERSAT